MMVKKAQISIIEFTFVMVLLSATIGYLIYSFPLQSQDYDITLNSMLDSIYYSEDYRAIFMDENLAVGAKTENWNSLSSVLNKTLGNYELILYDDTNEKYIFSCNETLGKKFSERIIAIKNNTLYDFRKIRLGVCY